MQTKGAYYMLPDRGLVTWTRPPTGLGTPPPAPAAPRTKPKMLRPKPAQRAPNVPPPLSAGDYAYEEGKELFSRKQACPGPHPGAPAPTMHAAIHRRARRVLLRGGGGPASGIPTTGRDGGFE